MQLYDSITGEGRPGSNNDFSFGLKQYASIALTPGGYMGDTTIKGYDPNGSLLKNNLDPRIRERGQLGKLVQNPGMYQHGNTRSTSPIAHGDYLTLGDLGGYQSSCKK